jgi:hypothetical protein
MTKIVEFVKLKEGDVVRHESGWKGKVEMSFSSSDGEIVIVDGEIYFAKVFVKLYR